jgi:hypothetical protein
MDFVGKKCLAGSLAFFGGMGCADQLVAPLCTEQKRECPRHPAYDFTTNI